MKKILFLFIAAFSILNASKPQLTVSILPQKYFVEKIVKDNFDVNVMVKPGASPHTYEPKSSEMRSLANSKIYFYTDVSFEKVWLDKFKLSAKNTTFINTANAIEKITMEKHTHENEGKHEEHNHDKHENESLDPHIWLDPVLVKIQAKNIYDAIVKIDSKNSEFYKTNYEEFLKEIDLLNTELKTILKPFENRAFMVFHPSWGYFAKRYNMEQIAVEVEGKEPKPNELVELIKDAKKHNIKIVFVSPQFSQKTAKTISHNIQASVISIDALSEKWADNLLLTAKEIANSYSK
ncbi:MAG: zinc ABC transporter substrate-binding protein [Aliarcobacter sp.]|nr:zinc ABC transporter substrate-binding protein [Aliarcobacter sp.]